MYHDPNGEPNPDMPESVPSGDKPRWTVDDEGWFKYGSDRVLLALCVFGDLAILPPEARDELKAAVRESAEVPALHLGVGRPELHSLCGTDGLMIDMTATGVDAMDPHTIRAERAEVCAGCLSEARRLYDASRPTGNGARHDA